MEPSSFVMPTLPASCCNLVQPGVSTVWTGQSVVESGRGLTVECLQAGEAFSVENTSQELNDLNDEIVSIFSSSRSTLLNCQLKEVKIKTYKLKQFYMK